MAVLFFVGRRRGQGPRTMTKQPTRSAPYGYLTETETAYRLGLTAFGLRGWRRRGYGPSFKKLG